MIQLKDVSFKYGRSKKVFEGLDLELKQGCIYGLLGQNGAGKTTLIKILAGLLFPQTGSCTLAGFTPQKRTPEFLQQVFLAPEEFYLPDVRISEIPRLYGSFYPTFSSTEFNRILSEFDVDASQRIKQLSYGQRKKALLSFGMATQSQVLLLDEPTNGLDIPSKSQFRKIIASAATDERTIIISTHQVRDLESLLDHLLILDHSDLVLNHSMSEISEKLCFKTVFNIDQPEEVIYSESSIKGYALIAKNTGGEASKIDLELLFNGALANRKAIAEALKN